MVNSGTTYYYQSCYYIYILGGINPVKYLTIWSGYCCNCYIIAPLNWDYITITGCTIACMHMYRTLAKEGPWAVHHIHWTKIGGWADIQGISITF